MNSNWSSSPETVKLGCDLCDHDHVHIHVHVCVYIYIYIYIYIHMYVRRYVYICIYICIYIYIHTYIHIYIYIYTYTHSVALWTPYFLIGRFRMDSLFFNWAFPDCNSSLNSPMATKWCTKLEVEYKRCPIVFQGHMSNCKVTWLKKSSMLTQIGRFQTITPVWIHQWLRNEA